MQTNLLTAILAIGLVVFIVQPTLAQDTCASCTCEMEQKTSEKTHGSAQETCPVTDRPINKDVYTDYNGKRVYFCCANCVETFTENPEKYLEKMKKDGVTLQTLPEGNGQAVCPVSGMAVNPEVYVDHDGKRIYFCCEGCVDKFKQDPDTYLEKMNKDGITLQDIPEGEDAIVCPVSGEPANKEIFTEYQGEKIHFCCEDCKAMFLKSPEKYVKKK